jgi:OmcA/MtrC family decaheme c-type cytochrome
LTGCDGVRIEWFIEDVKVKSTLVRIGLIALVIGSLASCGGGGGTSAGSGAVNNTSNTVAGDPVVPAGAVTDGVAAAGVTDGVSNASPLVNPKMAFQLVGPSPLTVSGAPVVNFAVVDSSGKHVPGLKLFSATGATDDPACRGSNVTFAIAKFDGFVWQNLISRQRLAANTATQFSVIEGTTDPKPTATITNPATALTDPATRVVGMLEENSADGYYTYRFATDVSKTLLMADAVDQKNMAPGKVANNGNLAVKDGATVHRVALQLCYVDPVTKATVKVNPYLDFTLGADGRGTPLKDTQGALTDVKKVVDRASCNECHKTFAQHGGGRVDPNYCVMCHNPGSKDFNTNNEIDFKLMVHKFHMGRLLKNDYQVASAIAKKTVAGVVTGIIYPQNQKNCVKCHDGSTTAVHKTAQGDNWKTVASKNACFACHDDYKVATSYWQQEHKAFNVVGLSTSDPDSSKDFACQSCHGGQFSLVDTAAKHAIPQWTLGENYQYNILNVTLNPATSTTKRTVTVRYSVSNPKDGSEYDLWDNSKYSYTTVSGSTTTRNFVFGNLSMVVGWNTADYTNEGAMARPWNSSCTVAPTASPTCDATTGRPTAATLAPASGASAVGLVREGSPTAINALSDSSVVRVGSSNQFELTSTELPDGASGTGVVAFLGAVKVSKTVTIRDPATSYTVPVKNVVSYFALTDAVPVPRRVVVSADKCNTCHGRFLGFSNTTTAAPGFGGHGGNRNDPQACVICHNGNGVLRDASITNGVTTYGTTIHFKSFIHALHKEQADNYPVWPLTKSTSTGAMAGIYTGIKNCGVCHEGDSYKSDKGVQGSSVVYDVGVTNGTAIATSGTGLASIDVTPADNGVISPKASACYSCHTSDGAKSHMITAGGAQFATVTQANLIPAQETCNNCHQAGLQVAPVDEVHGQ